jgi:hypothetical protein
MRRCSVRCYCFQSGSGGGRLAGLGLLGEELAQEGAEGAGADRLVHEACACRGRGGSQFGAAVGGDKRGGNAWSEAVAQDGKRFEAGAAGIEVVVAQDHVGPGAAEVVQRVFRRCGRHHPAGPARQQLPHGIGDGRLVVDKKNEGVLEAVQACRAPGGWDRLRASGDDHGERAAPAGHGADLHTVSEKGSEPLNDGEAEAKALAALGRGAVELAELREDFPKLVGRDAGTCVVNLDGEAAVAAAAAEQDAPFGRLADRVDEKVLEDATE